MRKTFSKKAVLLPLPVYIIGTYDENGKANAKFEDIRNVDGENKKRFWIDL